MAKVEKIIRADPGVAHSIGLCGISFVEQANASNFGPSSSSSSRSTSVKNTELRADAIMAQLAQASAPRRSRTRTSSCSAPRRFPASASPAAFKLMVARPRRTRTRRPCRNRPKASIRKLKQQVGDDVGKQKKADDERRRPARAEQMLTGVNTQFRSNTPQLYMDIDRTKVASLGVSLRRRQSDRCSIFLGSLYVNSFNEFGRYWQVTLQADATSARRSRTSTCLQVRNNKGQMVPLGTLVKLREDSRARSSSGATTSTPPRPITGRLLPGVSSGDVIDAVDKIADDDACRSR